MTRAADALAAALAEQPKRPKYGNRRTVVDDISFASAREATRYSELKLLERAGEITDLKLQPAFPLDVNGKPVCRYVADFSFTTRAGVFVVEDAKGVRTDAFRIKAALFEAIHGFPVREV